WGGGGGGGGGGGEGRGGGGDGGRGELTLPAEVAVQRGAGAAGLTGNVVEGGLGEPVPGDAGEGGPDRAVLDALGRRRGEALGLGGHGGGGPHTPVSPRQ